MAKHLINLVILLVIIGNSNNASAQCWKADLVPEGYKINKIYKIDSLIVSENMYKVLDHSIALIDSLAINKNETWLFFAISIYSKYDSIYGNTIRFELNQGTSNDAFEYHSYIFQLELCGAFCYKDYTFFVLCQNKDLLIFKELFTSEKQKSYPLIYNKPTIQERWIGIDFPETQKYIYMFYDYKCKAFKYVATRPSN